MKRPTIFRADSISLRQRLKRSSSTSKQTNSLRSSSLSSSTLSNKHTLESGPSSAGDSISKSRQASRVSAAPASSSPTSPTRTRNKPSPRFQPLPPAEYNLLQKRAAAKARRQNSSDVVITPSETKDNHVIQVADINLVDSDTVNHPSNQPQNNQNTSHSVHTDESTNNDDPAARTAFYNPAPGHTFDSETTLQSSSLSHNAPSSSIVSTATTATATMISDHPDQHEMEYSDLDTVTNEDDYVFDDDSNQSVSRSPSIDDGVYPSLRSLLYTDWSSTSLVSPLHRSPNVYSSQSGDTVRVTSLQQGCNDNSDAIPSDTVYNLPTECTKIGQNAAPCPWPRPLLSKKSKSSLPSAFNSGVGKPLASHSSIRSEFLDSETIQLLDADPVDLINPICRSPPIDVPTSPSKSNVRSTICDYHDDFNHHDDDHEDADHCDDYEYDDVPTSNLGHLLHSLKSYNLRQLLSPTQAAVNSYESIDNTPYIYNTPCSPIPEEESELEIEHGPLNSSGSNASLPKTLATTTCVPFEVDKYHLHCYKCCASPDESHSTEGPSHSDESYDSDLFLEEHDSGPIEEGQAKIRSNDDNAAKDVCKSDRSDDRAQHDDHTHDDSFILTADDDSLSIEDIDFNFVYALHTFVAVVDGQANAVKGDTMVLLDDTNSYWWLVRLVKDNSIGYLPAEHIETPTERLARLNKHRNHEMCSSMLGDQVEKPKPTLRDAILRRKKVVTFGENSYSECKYDEVSGSDSEDEAEIFQQQREAARQQQESETTRNDVEERAVAGSVSTNPFSSAWEDDQVSNGRGSDIGSGDDNDQNLSDNDVEDEAEVVKRQEEAFRRYQENGQSSLENGRDDDHENDTIDDGPLTPSRSKSGTIRNTDSFFKDDSVETKKITLTPNILRDDAGSSEPKRSLERSDSDSVWEDKKKDKKEKEKEKEKDSKKSGGLRSLFSRKDKKRGEGDEEDASKRSIDLNHAEGPSTVGEEAENMPGTPTSSSFSSSSSSSLRSVSSAKLRKAPPPPQATTATKSMTDGPAADGISSSTSSAIPLAAYVPDQPNDIISNPPPLAPHMSSSTSSSGPSSDDIAPPPLGPVELASEETPFTQIPSNCTTDSNDMTSDVLSTVSRSETSTPVAAYSTPPTHPIHHFTTPSSPSPDITPRSSLRLNTGGSSTSQRYSQLSIAISPLTPSDDETPPVLITDSSSRGEYTPSPEIPEDQENRYSLGGQKMMPNERETMPSALDTYSHSVEPPIPDWDDAKLRAFFDDTSSNAGNDIRDMLVVVYDKSDVAPAGPDHPVAGSLFREENAKLAEITTQLDNMLGDWLARKQRLRGAL